MRVGAKYRTLRTGFADKRAVALRIFEYTAAQEINISHALR